MSVDTAQGRCRDCFARSDALTLVEDFQSLGLPRTKIPIHFCPKCLEARHTELVASLPVREIGIPADKPNCAWMDLPPVTLRGRTTGIKDLTVLSRFRKPAVEDPTDADGGEVRMKIGDNNWWDAPGDIDITLPPFAGIRGPLCALSNVKGKLRRLFHPHMGIDGEEW